MHVVIAMSGYERHLLSVISKIHVKKSAFWFLYDERCAKNLVIEEYEDL